MFVSGWTAHMAIQNFEMMMMGDMKNGILGVVSAVHDVWRQLNVGHMPSYIVVTLCIFAQGEY